MSDAAIFAQEAHGDQKYGDDPYSVHLFDVMGIALSINDKILHPAFIGDVAWLHDVVEDTDVTLDDLEEAFGLNVASAVALVTDPEGASRKEKKAALNERLSSLDVSRIDHRAALLVKAADRVANVRSSKELILKGDAKEKKKGEKFLRMYRDEHAAFRKAAFREGLSDRLWAELDEAMA